jgi:hypothetical protein
MLRSSKFYISSLTSWMHISYIQHVPRAPLLIVIHLVTQIISTEDLSNEASYYEIFSSFLLLSPPYGQISSATPYSRAPSGYVRFLIWETKFQACRNQQTYFNFMFFWPCIILWTCFIYQLNAQFLYSITIYMLHYNPRHVSSCTVPIFSRSYCIIRVSGIVILCKRPYSVPVKSGLQSAINRHILRPFTDSDDTRCCNNTTSWR